MSDTTYRPDPLRLSQPNVLINLAGSYGAGLQDDLNYRRNVLLFDRAQREDTNDQAFRAAAPGAIAGDAEAMAAATAADPDRALVLKQHLDSLDTNARRKSAENANVIAEHLASFLGVPDTQGQAQWPTMLEALKARGIDTSKIPQQYPGQPAVAQASRTAQDLTAQLKAYDERITPIGGDVAQYQPLINAASQTHGVRPELISAMISGESGGNPNAVSPKGAAGLTQLMPATAREVGVTNPSDPAQAINGGTAYLAQNIKKYGNEALGLIAYNWGPANTDRWLAGGAKIEELPAETRAYVNGVLSKAQGGQAVPLGRKGEPIIKDGYQLMQMPDGQRAWQPLPSKKAEEIPKGMKRDPATGRLVADQDYIAAQTQIDAAHTAATTRPTEPKPPTEDQNKAALYAHRMVEAEQIIQQTEAAGQKFWQRARAAVPVAGNYVVSDDYQKFDQAQRNFVNATLRRESGAVISDAEFANANKQYFPQPGDGPGVLRQKEQNRRTAIEELRRTAGAAARDVPALGKPRHGDGPTSASARPQEEAGTPDLPRVKTPADARALPPGTEFIDPNGVRRRVP